MFEYATMIVFLIPFYSLFQLGKYMVAYIMANHYVRKVEEKANYIFNGWRFAVVVSSVFWCLLSFTWFFCVLLGQFKDCLVGSALHGIVVEGVADIVSKPGGDQLLRQAGDVLNICMGSFLSVEICFVVLFSLLPLFYYAVFLKDLFNKGDVRLIYSGICLALYLYLPLMMVAIFPGFLFVCIVLHSLYIIYSEGV